MQYIWGYLAVLVLPLAALRSQAVALATLLRALTRDLAGFHSH